MWPNSEYAHPVSSYQNPVPVPGSDPDTGPFTTVAFSTAWLPYVVGSLKQLLLQSTWDTTDPSVVNLAQERAFNLLQLFSGATGVLDVRLNPDNPCELQKETSPGVWETYGTIADCIAETSPGTASGYTPDGLGGYNPFPSGSPDGRFDKPAPPPWPSGTVPSGQTAQCLAGANNAQAFKTCITNLATVLTAGADALGALASVEGIVGLFMPGLDLTAIITGLVGFSIGLGGSALSTLFDDAAYHKYACIINCRCEADGSVTKDEWGLILSDVHSQFSDGQDFALEAWLQINGSVGLTRMGKAPGIVSADCTDCVCPWEHHFDFTTGQHGWVVGHTGSDLATYVTAEGFAQNWPTATAIGITSPNVGSSNIDFTTVKLFLNRIPIGDSPTGYYNSSDFSTQYQRLDTAEIEYDFTAHEVVPRISLQAAPSRTTPTQDAGLRIVGVTLGGPTGPDPYAGL